MSVGMRFGSPATVNLPCASSVTNIEENDHACLPNVRALKTTRQLRTQSRPRLETLEERTLLSFAAAANYGAAYLPQSMAVADFNRDGNPDVIAVSRSYFGSVNVFLGTSTGALFAWRHQSQRVHDQDCHGRLQPRWHSRPGRRPRNRKISILLGNGDATFRSGQLIDLGGKAASDIAVGDANRDGIPDIVVSISEGPNQAGRVGLMWGMATGRSSPWVLGSSTWTPARWRSRTSITTVFRTCWRPTGAATASVCCWACPTGRMGEITQPTREFARHRWRSRT